MGNYQGIYNRTLDAKKRLQIPSKLVDGVIPAKFYMLKGLDGCIAVYDQAGYDAHIKYLQNLMTNDLANRKYVRTIMMSINQLDVDSHGRITLGETLSNMYGIGNSVSVLGMIDHFEIWDPTKLEEYMNSGDESFEELAERSAK